MKISVVLPCYNEEYTLAACIKNAHALIQALKCTGEVIVSNNNSTDASEIIARANGARVVNVQTIGYGAALNYGIQASKGTYVVIGDADGSYNFLDAIPMLELLEKKHYDFTIGSRLKGVIEPGAMPWTHKYIGTPFLTALVNFLYHGQISDINSGLRAFRKSNFETLSMQSVGMEFASEMVIKALKLNVKIAEVPITFQADKRNKKPHLRPIRDGLRHIFIIIRLYFTS